MIEVIDAPCGAGKTEWAISYMNAHPEESFIFVTPFLSEVDRIKSNVNGFYDPQPFNRKGLFGGEQGAKRKIDDFNDLLAKGKNIVTTHTTFTNATQETINNLMCNEYHLILDETVDVLLPLNNLVPRIKKSDADFLLKNKIVEVDENYRVRWKGISQSLEGDKGAYAYSEVQRHAESENLLLIDKRFFVWEFSPEVFRAVSKVTILTYQLEGSFLYPYRILKYMALNIKNSVLLVRMARDLSLYHTQLIWNSGKSGSSLLLCIRETTPIFCLSYQWKPIGETLKTSRIQRRRKL